MRQLMLICAVTFGIAYFAIERAGVFSSYPESSLKILYSFPVLIDALAIMIIAAASAFLKRSSMRAGDWMGVAALMLIVSGLWLGHFTRFSAEVILTEGQDFYSGHGDYVPGTFYRGTFAKPPGFRAKIERLSPSFSEDGRKVERLEGKIVFHSVKGTTPAEYTLTDGLPELIEGAMFRLKDFGYSPRYALKSKAGKVLDSAFVYMNLFPPGNEGFFRLLSPLTYYIRYYPEGNQDTKEPLFRLRIVRNKDIVLNRDVALGEDVDFENSRISFEEVRMWTKLSVKRDWGEVLAFFGLIMGILYLAGRHIKGKH